MKKIVLIALGISIVALLVLGLDFKGNKRGGCAFCNEEVLARQVFYKGEGALGVLTYKPAVPGHVLIIPERHVERVEDLTPAEMAAIGSTIQKVHRAVSKTFGNNDYLLIQKNGKGAGQTVPHVHFHYLPAEKFLALRFLTAHLFKPATNEEIRLLNETLSQQF